MISIKGRCYVKASFYLKPVLRLVPPTEVEPSKSLFFRGTKKRSSLTAVNSFCKNLKVLVFQFNHIKTEAKRLMYFKCFQWIEVLKRFFKNIRERKLN